MQATTGSDSPQADQPAHESRRWLLAVLLGTAVAGIRYALKPVLGDELLFALALPATVVAALLLGFGPGLVTAAIAATGVVLTADTLRAPVLVAGFLGTALLICSATRLPTLWREREARARDDGNHGVDTSLTRWLRAVLVGAALIPMVVFALVAWWGYNRAHVEAETKASHASDLALRHAQRALEAVEAIARQTGDATSGPDADVRAHEQAIHQRLGDMALGAAFILNMNAWDAAGRPLVRSDIFPVNPEANVHDREYFVEQRERDIGVGISEVLIGRQSGKELLNVTVRRPSADGSFRGIVAVSLVPEYFREYYRSLAADEPTVTAFALARSDGALLARWPRVEDGRARIVASSPLLPQMRRGQPQGMAIVNATEGGERRMVSYRRVEGFPLYVIAGISYDAVLASWLRFVGLVATWMVPMAAGLLFVSWIALKKTRLEQTTAAELHEEVRRRSDAERLAVERQKLETLAALTGGVAHDFNNLLAVIEASLHVHRLRHPELADESHLQAMGRATRAGVRLTRQLLSFSRRQALRPEVVNLHSWLPTMQEILRTSLGPNIEATLDVQPGTKAVWLDTAELELALINLALNARHAMPGGGRFEVSAANAQLTDAAHAGAEMVVIKVRDDGCGIAAEVLPRVTEPFFTTRARGEGSGLGLAQVRTFCAQAGGFLRIESTVGQGTTLRLFVPVAAHQAGTDSGQPHELPRAEAAALTGELLLVEDNEDLAATLALLLSEAGLQVRSCRSVDEALQQLAAGYEPDVVLSDVSMPGHLDGIGLAFKLQLERPKLPVLLMTGYAEQLAAAVAAGFEVFPKPTQPSRLLTRLRSAIEQKRAATA